MNDISVDCTDSDSPDKGQLEEVKMPLPSTDEIEMAFDDTAAEAEDLEFAAIEEAIQLDAVRG